MFIRVSPILFVLTVAVLGFLTPGYNHISHTISRLGIEKYGWIQSINLLQFALALFLIGENIASTMEKKISRTVVRRTFSLSAFVAVFAAFIPTDPIENVRFSFTLLSPAGTLHVGIVLLFLLIAPFGISRLSQTFAREPRWRSFARPTKLIGYATFSLSILWFFLYAAGILQEYRGLFQKIITLLPLFWLMRVNAPKNTL